MGYDSANPFGQARTVIISKVVCGRIVIQHMGLLWTNLTLETMHSTRGHLFEAFVRRLMLQGVGNTFSM